MPSERRRVPAGTATPARTTHHAKRHSQNKIPIRANLTNQEANEMRLQDYDITTKIEASVASSDRLTPADSPEEVRELLLTLATSHFDARPGQSIGVLAPGQFGQKHHFRLYTLADLPDRISDHTVRVRICVRRCNYIDPYSGEEYQGVASNFLCDLLPGDTLSVTGPYEAPFELPDEPDAALILIGAGTGIAPFRAFVKHIYQESPEFTGRIWLFHGGRTGLDLLYMNEKRNDFALYMEKETFEAIMALSHRPHWTNSIDWHGAIESRGEELWKFLLDFKTYVYVAGLEPIRDELDRVFAKLAGSAEKWARRKAELIAGGRWTELLY
jgi:ferredoxin--NADP+ reductase